VTHATRQKLVEDLIRDEGEELKPYVDTVGKTTIGVGRNLTDVGISREESRMMLARDVSRVLVEMSDSFPWAAGMTENRQRVLANMLFNMGLTKLRGFKNTLNAMSEGRYQKAADGMRASKWYRQVGARAERLATLMEQG
jgi:lysozyme